MDAAISDRLQNTSDEAERIGAFAELKAYLAEHPTDPDALNLMDKFGRRFETDWSTKTVSPRP
jgi:hypothetical protein